MTHRSLWRCRGCKTPLGVVRHDGSLELHVVGATVRRDGLLRVPCPACRQVRPWRPVPVPNTRAGRASPGPPTHLGHRD